MATWAALGPRQDGSEISELLEVSPDGPQEITPTAQRAVDAYRERVSEEGIVFVDSTEWLNEEGDRWGGTYGINAPGFDAVDYWVVESAADRDAPIIIFEKETSADDFEMTCRL